DLQVNGIGDIDVSHAEGDDWSTLDIALLEKGVTTWCPTVVSAPLGNYPKIISRITEAQYRRGGLRPTIAGIHLEGPFLGDAPGAHDPRHILQAASLWLDAIPNNVRIFTLAPENASATLLIDHLRAHHVVVAIGHTRATDVLTVAAIDAGATLVTHLYNGMSCVHHRDDGVALVALTDDRVAVSLIADLLHVRPRAINLAFRAKPSGVVLITDSVASQSEAAKQRGIVISEGAPRLPNGTLAGSRLKMNIALKNVVESCHVDLSLALQAATATPARLLGLADRGTIEVGRRADLVVMEANFEIQRTWVGGELAPSRH
ncbi:MAG: amidohydrolase family protein, partial [Actinomycetota bacterium]